jgi:hypothetical protein
MLKLRDGDKVLDNVKILIAAYHSLIAAVPELLLKGLCLQPLVERLDQSAHRSDKLIKSQGLIERACSDLKDTWPRRESAPACGPLACPAGPLCPHR